MLQNPPRHRLESFRQTRERQNTLNTKLNSAVDENDRASATTGQHQDSQHRQKAYMSQIATYRIRITIDRQDDKRMSGTSKLQRKAATISLLLPRLTFVLYQFARSEFPLGNKQMVRMASSISEGFQLFLLHSSSAI